MAYFKIGGVDYSDCVNSLEIEAQANYIAQTNAAGNTVVDFINRKRVIKVGIIPLDDKKMIGLQSLLDEFNVSITFRNPRTGTNEVDVSCIIPSTNIQYYTIQVGKVLYKAFQLEFIEL